MIESIHEVLFNNPALSIGLFFFFIAIALFFGTYIYGKYNAIAWILFDVAFIVIAVFSLIPALEYFDETDIDRQVNEAKQLLEKNGYIVELDDSD